MKKINIIGVDISKNTIDFHCHGHQFTPEPVGNNLKGHRQFERWIKLKVSKQKEEVLIVMEYTGIYTYNLERFLGDRGWNYVKRPALDIKRSTGIQRGKSDTADARMISRYGWLNRDVLKPHQPMNDNLVALQQLLSYREKLVSDKASHQVRLKELKEQLSDKLHEKISQSSQFIIDMLTLEIKELDRTINNHVAEDESLQRNFELLTSIRGIGPIIAITLIVVTENFTRFDSHRKFACYCGIAPFTYTSGTSIRGKTRVSQLANKKVKALLTLAVFTAIQHDQDLKIKYEQKRKEGKPAMSVINIIRAKLVERIFTVINRQTPYILKPAA